MKVLIGMVFALGILFSARNPIGAADSTGTLRLTVTIAPFAPAGISNLTALTSSSSEILLQWTAPGDAEGRQPLFPGSLYRIRYSSVSVIRSADFDSPPSTMAVQSRDISTGTVLVGEPQSTTITGLLSGTTYHFAIKTMGIFSLFSVWNSSADAAGVNVAASTTTLPDTTAPNAISNLTALAGALDGDVLLSWSVPGDDGSAGTLPVGSLYRIRRSTNPITNFASAPAPFFETTVSTSAIAPQTNASLTLTGMNPGTSYFFAIVTRDEAGVESPWSTGAFVNTANNTASHDLPLSAPSGLSVLSTFISSVTLAWTNPPPPASIDDRSLYRVYQATYNFAGITDANVSLATSANHPSASISVTGLASGSLFFFRVSAVDQGDQGFGLFSLALESALSIISTQTTIGIVPDTFAPSSITNLSALLAGAVEGEIRLTWNAPGDDGTVGTAFLYIVRRATWSALAGDATGWWNHASLTTLATPPVPLISGSAQSMTVTGLAPGTTYFFGIRTQDEVPNISDFDMGVSTPALQARSLPQSDVTAPATVSDFAILSVSTTTATIRWTTPGDDGTVTSPLDAAGRAEEVTIKWSTFSMTLADFLAIGASSTSVRTASTAGIVETVVITGLQQATPYFFVLRYRDEVPNFSGLSNQPSQSTQDNLPPSPPLFFTATPRPDLGNAIALTWTNPPEPDFTGIRILARTDQFPTGPADPAARLVATTAVGQIAALDTGLTGGATFFYSAFSFDAGFFFSSASTASAIAPQPLDIIKPLEPRGLDSTRAPDGSFFTLTWLPVEKNVNGTAANDLVSYRVYRSTPFFEPKTLFATISSTLTTFTDGTIAGETFHYYVTALDFSGNESTRSVVMGSSAEMMMFVLAPDNSGTMLQIPKILREGMKKENNTFGDDLWITVERLLDEEIGRRLRVYRFKALKFKSSQEAAGFIFPSKDVLAMISYADAVKGGVILGGAPSMASQVNLPIADAPNQLALFWFNGNEYIKIGGDVDTASRFVSIKTNRAGKFALVQSLRATEFTLNTVFPRIFSPNGDGWNDVATFVFENPQDSGVQGKIFDIGGGFVANMTPGGLPDTLRWDGKDSSGKVVSAGIYLYQIKAEGKNLTGTVVVAR